MSRRRALPLGISVIALGALVLALAGLGVFDSASTRLRVAVEGLPDDVAAAVTVVGPVTYTVAAHEDERDVPAGDYTLRITPVGTELGKAYGEVDEQPIRVPHGTTTTTTADYAVIIPDTTKVLDHRAPGISRVEATRVTFATGSPSEAALVPGNVFIVAEGPETPDPMARRVDAVTRTPDGLVVDTTPVLLSEALPAGKIVLDDPADGLGFRPVAYEPPPMLSINFGSLVASRQETPGGKGRCSGATPDVITELHNMRPDLGGSFRWKAFPPHAEAKLTATLNPQVSFKVDIKGAIECSVRFDKNVKWLDKLCGKVIAKVVRIGPLSLDCEVEPFLSVALRSQTGTSMVFDTTFHIGVKDNRPGMSISDFRPAKDFVQHVVDGVDNTGTIGSEIGLSIGLSGRDPTRTAWLGMDIEVAIGPKVVVTSTEAEALLAVRLAVKGRMGVDARFKEWKTSKKLLELERKFRLWHTDARPFRVTGTPAGPGPDRVPVNAVADCATGGCTTAAVADNVRPGLHVALVTKPSTGTATTAHLVSFRSGGEYVDSTKILATENFYYLPEQSTGPFACDKAGRCVVAAGVGAHSEVANVAELGADGRFRDLSKDEIGANSGIRPVDVDGDGTLELLKVFSDENPDFAAGTRYWELMKWTGTSFASQGCRRHISGEERPSGPVSPADCPR